MNNKIKITVIVSTYNWPDSLNLVLESLKTQTDCNFEVVIADDGSSDSTKAVIRRQKKKFPVPLKHAWQEDLGYRLAAVRNLALQKAEGEYIIFIDGDCIVRPHFVENHRKLAEQGFFVTGTRILVSQSFSYEITKNSINIGSWNLKKYLILKLQGKLNKFFPLLNFPIFRHFGTLQWKHLRGCNFAVWRKDLEKVNGLDESFQGWGYEDSDLAIRLINSGVKRKSGKFAVTVFHLWHKINKTVKGHNWDLLQERIKSHVSYAKNGFIKND